MVEQLLAQMLYRTGRHSAPAEQWSWKRSLPVLAADLVDAGLGDVEMLVEYHLPLTSQRADVFLLDEHQVERPGEMGTLRQIEQHARHLGLGFQHIALGEQFRCGGSEEYVHWVVSLLGLDGDQPPVAWSGDPQFHVEVAETPEEMEAKLTAQIRCGYSAPITAGYCWPWSDARRDGTLVPDVRIGNWSRPWNS